MAEAEPEPEPISDVVTHLVEASERKHRDHPQPQQVAGETVWGEVPELEPAELGVDTDIEQMGG